MSKRIHIPPLSALRAVEAAVRLGSFTEAAAALSVTQGAVSHAVKNVEETLGRRLFLRRHQEIVPTKVAAELAEAIRESIGRLERAFDRAADDGGRLAVKVQPTVAMRWLMPRLGDFKRAHPGVDLRVAIGWEAVDFKSERFDAGIAWNPEPEEGVVALKLFEAEMIAVAAPSYLAGRAKDREPTRADRIIQNEPTGRTWLSWLDAAGLPSAGFEPTITTDTDDAAIRLALSGQGITLATTRFVADDLALGSLAVVGAGHACQNGAYYLVGLADRAEEPAFVAFRDWLTALAALPALAPAVPPAGDGGLAELSSGG